VIARLPKMSLLFTFFAGKRKWASRIFRFPNRLGPDVPVEFRCRDGRVMQGRGRPAARSYPGLKPWKPYLHDKTRRSGSKLALKCRVQTARSGLFAAASVGIGASHGLVVVYAQRVLERRQHTR
jgi:hypothetical protein